jgi:histidine ammonia-lyase
MRRSSTARAMSTLTLRPGALALSDLRGLWAAPARLAVDAAARPAVDAAADTVARVIDAGRTVYGVNTGFGLLARTRIDAARLAELQRALVLSHSAGTGALLDDAVVRLVVALKAASLARGHSGIRWSVIEALVALANAGVVPSIPAQGSVGASGDLAPLAHLAAVLIGEGEARFDGRTMPGRDALAAAGLARVELGRWRLRSSRARSPSTRASAATRRSTRASRRCAGIAARRTPRACIATSSPAARSVLRTRTAPACRIPTACAASRR